MVKRKYTYNAYHTCTFFILFRYNLHMACLFFRWPQEYTITRQWCYLLFPLGADVINFDGHVVLPYRFRNKKMKTLKDVISLKFKTSESEGVIFHGEGQQGDYITLELKKAKLVLNLNLGMFWLFSFVVVFSCPTKILGQMFHLLSHSNMISQII